MTTDRRAALAALGATLPLGLPALAGTAPHVAAPGLRLVAFEAAVLAAFRAAPDAAEVRVEVGHSAAVQAGLQGCVNDRPFAGFPAGGLRVVRAGGGPGPAVGGVRLYVATVDVARTGGRAFGEPGRPLDFASLPPASTLVRPATGGRANTHTPGA